MINAVEHVVILVPGAPTLSSDLTPLADGLRDMAEVHIVEPPGYGQTPQADHSMAARARLLASLRRSLTATRVSVVGYSAGGYDALAAVELGASFDRVVLLDANIGLADLEREPYRQLAAAIRTASFSSELMAQRLLAPVYAARPEMVERAAAWLSATAPLNLAGEIASFADAPDLTEVAIRLGDRLRIVHATLDAAIPFTRAEALAERTGAPLISLDGLGHACLLESPSAVIAALRVALN